MFWRSSIWSFHQLAGACSPRTRWWTDDPKPPATGTTAPSGAPGGAPGEAGLPLADAITKIPVTEEQRTGYERDSFKHWVDEDDNGCPARQEVLIAESVTAPKQGDRCTLSGGSWMSYYDEAEVTDAKKLDIDHIFPLAETWDSGAHDWTPERREAYANDLGAERSLVAVTAKTNRSKADKDPAAWMPPAPSATCIYLVDWTATKLRWGLSADETEQAALLELTGPCADSTVAYGPALQSTIVHRCVDICVDVITLEGARRSMGPPRASTSRKARPRCRRFTCCSRLLADIEVGELNQVRSATPLWG
ncbi:HNH endonuclease family protein [Streptomyces atroolivaceus]|uniref:HNH endonuclease family protein n=1 Tax=Streptomyces atroolivaceus TaxID=66869 RepID=A0ABV9VJ24_STRAZ